MKFTIKSFGIAKDIVGDRNVVIETDVSTVGELRSWLTTRYPSLTKLRSLFIAVNQNYAADETAVVVAVATKHRRASFEACQYIIDRLKEKVPIFKKEVFEDGAEWISATRPAASAQGSAGQ